MLLPLLLLLLSPGSARSEDLRHDCLAWQRAHGSEQVALADRIGSAQLLTRASLNHYEYRSVLLHTDDPTNPGRESFNGTWIDGEVRGAFEVARGLRLSADQHRVAGRADGGALWLPL